MLRWKMKLLVKTGGPAFGKRSGTVSKPRAEDQKPHWVKGSRAPRLASPPTHTPQGSLLPAFPVLPIPEALSFYFVSGIKWNPTTGGRLPNCLLFGVKGLASRKQGMGTGREPDPERPAAAVMAATVASPGAPSCPAQRHFEHLPCFLLSPPLASPKPSRLVDQTPPRQPPRRLPDKTPNPDSSPKRPAPQLHQAQASARAGRIAAWLLHLKPRRWQARGSPLIPLTLCAASRARSWRAPETFSCTGLCSTLSLFHPPNLYFQQGAGEQSNRARGQLLGGE